jgi:hypothetical protein
MEVPKEVDELKDDLVWAKHYVNQYKKLFLHNQKRLDLLNETAPNFFRDIQRMFWDEMTISVARLMDPHVQGSNKNLSLKILLKLAKDNQWNFESEIADLVEKARNKAESVINRRMKLIAHRDLPTAMGEVELDSIGIAEIEETLSLAGQALNVIYVELTGGAWVWDLILVHDADELMYYLKLAMIYKEKTEKEQDWQKDSELWHNSKYYDA